MLGLFGWVALATANCESSSTTDEGGTGGVDAGGGQPAGSCEEALGFKLAQCNLPPEGSACSSPCLAQCVRAGSCAELDALFTTGHPEGSLVPCFQACTASSGDGAGSPCNADADCAANATCGQARTCVVEDGAASGGGSNGSGAGGAGGDSSGSESGGDSTGSDSDSSGTSGGLIHPQCAAYANEICDTCMGANICGTGDCYSCAASTCDDIYDQCSAWLECQASTCGGSSCCGMPCSPC